MNSRTITIPCIRGRLGLRVTGMFFIMIGRNKGVLCVPQCCERRSYRSDIYWTRLHGSLDRTTGTVSMRKEELEERHLLDTTAWTAGQD